MTLHEPLHSNSRGLNETLKPTNQKKKKKVKSLNEAPKKEMNTASWLTVVWFKPPPVSFPYGDFVALSNSIAVTSYKGHLECSWEHGQ